MAKLTKPQAEADLFQALRKFVGAASVLDNLWSDYLARDDKPNLDLLTGGYPYYLSNFEEFVGDLRQWEAEVDLLQALRKDV